MNQAEAARRGQITDEMTLVATAEDVSPEEIREGMAAGSIVISGGSQTRQCRPVGIGQGLRTKINANVGMSSDLSESEMEIRKAETAVLSGADTLMDLSIAGPIIELRQAILETVKVPVGTVPIYQAAWEATERTGSFVSMTVDEILRTIEAHALQGCGNVALHCGVTRDIVEQLPEHSRIMKITSRGGSILAHWIRENERENPLYEYFDDILDIAAKYDMVISLGAGLRSGCVADGADDIHMQELLVLSKLARRAIRRNVQVKIEGPGHMVVSDVEFFIRAIKKICRGIPVGVLGPIVTDIAPGYDHITHAIGLAVAVMAGADFTSAVYPSEHLGLPQLEDITPGIMTARLAAHVGDLAKLGEKARKWDDEMSRARAALDWTRQFQLALDPRRARDVHKRVVTHSGGCSMCGALCALKNFPSA